MMRIWQPLSVSGFILGTLFFVAALTPTLVPRTYLTEGVLSGGSFAIGYAFGVFLHWLWAYLELPEPSTRHLRALKLAAVILCGIFGGVFLWRLPQSQNSIRLLMGLDPVTGGYPMRVLLYAVVTFLVLLAFGRLFHILTNIISARLNLIAPSRVSKVIGFALSVALLWTIANGFLLRSALNMIHASYRQLDGLVEPNRAQPTSMHKTGSTASLIEWNTLGRAGRAFIASGATAAEIGAVVQRPALEPIRVYVGLRSAETVTDRARLALAELKRVGAFERSALVIITPTGTGWIDPAAIDSIEYLRGGDIASVALQYSYLSSPFSLMIQPEYGANSARALFTEVYGYWTTLPRDARPKLYLHGLSLGAMNSEKSLELFETLGDPVDGALWSGPPFESVLWRAMTERRNAGSPEWLPQFRDGSFVRFMNQEGATQPADSKWGVMRIVYLQYASDPVTFFSYRDLYRSPDWMASPRGPDVSPDVQWYPLVTMLQLALDMTVSTTTPFGYGHVYSPEHYVNAWIAVAGVEGWQPAAIVQLKQQLAIREKRAAADPNSNAYADQGG